MPEDEWTAILDTNLTGIFARARFWASTCSNAVTAVSSQLPHSTASSPSVKWLHTQPASRVASLTRHSQWSGRKGVTVNAIRTRVFRTELNAQLLDSTPLARELLIAHPGVALVRLKNSIGAAVICV